MTLSDLAEEIVTTALGLSEPQAVVLKVGVSAIGQLLRHPDTGSTDTVSVISTVRGRIRMRVNLTRQNENIAARIETRLGALPGVRRVHVNTLTGTVLVTYDPTLHTPMSIVRATERSIAALRVVLADHSVGKRAVDRIA